MTVIDARSLFARRNVKNRWPYRLGRAAGITAVIAGAIGRAAADVILDLWSMVCAVWFAAAIIVIVFL